MSTENAEPGIYSSLSGMCRTKIHFTWSYIHTLVVVGSIYLTTKSYQIVY